MNRRLAIILSVTLMLGNAHPVGVNASYHIEKELPQDTVDCSDVLQEDSDEFIAENFCDGCEDGYEVVELPRGRTFIEGWSGYSDEELGHMAEEELLGEGTPSYDVVKVKEYLYTEFKARKNRIKLDSFTIPAADIGDIIDATINASPDLYAVRERYCIKDKEENAVYLSVKYDKYMDDELFESKVELALSEITDDMTDTEKVIVLHEYLVANCDYADILSDTDDLGGSTKLDEYTFRQHSAYGALVDRRAVCQGYAAAYLYLCKKAGVKCYYVTGQVTSSTVAHAWNMVELDGNNYHIDCTWDSSMFGKVDHQYLLLPDDGFPESNHYDWYVYDTDLINFFVDEYYIKFIPSEDASKKKNIKAEDAGFKRSFFKNTRSPIVLYEDSYYYIYGSCIYKIKRGEWSQQKAELVYKVSVNGIAISDTGGLFIYNDRLFFTGHGVSNDYYTTYGIFSVNLMGEDFKSEYNKSGFMTACNIYDDVVEYVTDRGVGAQVELGDTPSKKEIEYLKLSSKELKLGKGGMGSLKLVLRPSDYTISQCEISIQDDTVATISSFSEINNMINIKAVSPGTTVLNVSCAGKTASCIVDVVPFHVTSVEGAAFASTNDLIAPVVSSPRIKDLELDFTNVEASVVPADGLTMTVIKGAKLRTSKSMTMEVVGTDDYKKIKIKRDYKNGVAIITVKKSGYVNFSMRDSDHLYHEYVVYFNVEEPKAMQSVKKISVAPDKKVVLTLKDMFDTTIDGGKLTLVKEKVPGQAIVNDENKTLTITPEKKDKICVMYQYLDKKYRLNITVR